MNGGLEQMFIDLEEALEDDNFHSEAGIIEFIHESLANGRQLYMTKNNNGTYTIIEAFVEKPVVEEEVGTVEVISPSPSLPDGFVTEMVIKVDDNKFEKFVREKLGIADYNFADSIYEITNDTDYRFDMSDVDEKEFDIEAMEKSIELGKQDTYIFDEDVNEILEYLIIKGHLPKAVYLINVSW
jgi:hypothetical protein